MKLSQLQEAQYHVHPAVDMIERVRKTGEHLDHKFPLDQIDSTVSALTKKFGPPDSHNTEMYTGGSYERWIWDDFVVIRYEGFGFLENSKIYRYHDYANFLTP